MGKYKSLGRNSLYTFTGTFGSKIISFVMLPFYTHWLSVEDFAITDIVTVYSTLLISVATLSLQEAIFVFPSGKEKQQQNEYFTTALLFSLASIFVVFLLFLCLELLSTYFTWNNVFMYNKWLVFGLFSINYLQCFLQQFCRGVNKMLSYSISGVLLTLFTAVFSFLFIPTKGVIGYIISIIFANLISILYICIKEKIHTYLVDSSYSKQKLREMIKYSVPLIPNSVMWWIMTAINRPLLESYVGVSAIGLYAVANKFPNIIASVFNIFNTSWQVSALQEYTTESFSSFYNKVGLLYLPILILSSSVLAVCSSSLIAIITPPDYYLAWKLVPILSFAIVFMGASGYTGSVFSASKNSKYYFYSSVCGVIICVVANYLFIPFWGIMGAAISFSFSHFVVCALRFYYASKLVIVDHINKYFLMCLVNIFQVLFILNGYNNMGYLLLGLNILLFIFYNYTTIHYIFKRL